MPHPVFTLALRAAIVAMFLALAAPGAQAAPPTVETFFAKSPYGNARLSPNGQFLAVTMVYNGRYNASVIDLDTRKVTAITNLEQGDVTRIVWQNDMRMIVVIGDLHRGTGEPPKDFGLVAVNRDGSNVRQIGKSFTRFWSLDIVQVVPNSNEVLLSSLERSQYSEDLYRYDTVTGKMTLLTFDSPGNVASWLVDFDGVPRAATTADLDHDKAALYVRKSADDPWRKIEEAGFDRLKTRPVAFSADGKTLYLQSRRDADRDALYEYDIASDKWTGPVVKHADRDIDADFIDDVRERKIYGLRYVDDKPSVIWFDPEWARMQKSIDAVLPDMINRLQKAGDRWLVVSYSDRDPGEVYLLDGKSMKMEKVLSYVPAIDPAEMSDTKWVRYPARDGLTVPALLTIPKSAAGKPVPLVVDIHGGPNIPAAEWTYDPEVQFFASRGYAVLQPQFRGTEGFGWAYFSAGFRKWGDEMQDDLEDGVKWTVAQGLVDPERVCFFGASYGGYAAMWGSIKNARSIKCAVAYVGVSSIDYLFDNAQTDLADNAEKSTWMAERIGDPKTERDRFKRVNPLNNADRVGVPILLAYGAADLRVPLVHGTAFRAALDKYNKPYEWIVYNDEGHGFNRDDHLFDFYHRVDKFLAKYLGPVAATTKVN